MRFRISRMMTIFFCALVLCGCQGQKQETNGNDAKQEVEQGTVESTANEQSDLKMGFIFLHNEHSTYDLNFLNAAKRACENTGTAYEFRTNVPEGDKCFEAACELAEGGCDIIFADSFGHEDYLIKAAKKYPEVQFCHATGTRAHTEGMANYHNAFATIYEGRYISGVVAGMKLNEMIEAGTIKANQAKVGYIGAFTYAEVISGYTAFYLGAKSECPSVEMEVTFTGSWYDEDAEKRCAQELIARNCVLISQHADSLGAPSICETMGVPDISYNGSNLSACPETFLVASYIDWTPYFQHVISCVEKKTEIEADWVGNLETDSVKITPIGHNAPQGTAEKIEEVKQGLKTGAIQVFSTAGFTVAGEKVAAYQADVNTDAAYTPDTQVVQEGVFQESVYRSAPYFDLRIDGITLLDEAY